MPRDSKRTTWLLLLLPLAELCGFLSCEECPSKRCLLNSHDSRTSWYNVVAEKVLLETQGPLLEVLHVMVSITGLPSAGPRLGFLLISFTKLESGAAD